MPAPGIELASQAARQVSLLQNAKHIMQIAKCHGQMQSSPKPKMLHFQQKQDFAILARRLRCSCSYEPHYLNRIGEIGCAIIKLVDINDNGLGGSSAQDGKKR
ncbi:hypothetical protein A8B75_15935 [Sphingomonadales bacterium EhC05]|jgi:hypothetical protein|nr:hypothetical protein A8B75_15935 [Sphingomonadales bacterium EhC05]